SRYLQGDPRPLVRSRAAAGFCRARRDRPDFVELPPDIGPDSGPHLSDHRNASSRLPGIGREPQRTARKHVSLSAPPMLRFITKAQLDLAIAPRSPRGRQAPPRAT